MLDAFAISVTRFNRRVGEVLMWGLYAMLGVLLWSSIARTAFNAPPIWAVEMLQFMLAGYYILGGPWAMQQGAHVRMDLLWGRWSRTGRAFADTLTSFALIGYLALLLAGGVSSTQYALAYGQKNYSSWAPVLWPVKVAMVVGILLMVLQALAYLIRDVRRLQGRDIPETME